MQLRSRIVLSKIQSQAQFLAVLTLIYGMYRADLLVKAEWMTVSNLEQGDAV
jgi:hypothetical protein